jgi:MFS family permease
MSDVRWLLQLCLARTGFAFINTAFAALIPVLRPAWGMSAGEAGLVQSAWHGGYIVSLIVASQLAGRYGAKRTFLGMGYAASASALLFALGADGFVSAFLLYGLAGLCAGGSYVPGLTLIAERFPVARRGRAMGAYIAAASLGYAIALPGTVWLATGLGGDVSSGLMLGAAGCLFGQFLASWTLRETKNVLVEAVDRRILLSAASLRWLWRSPAARCVVLAYSFHAWELLGMWAWLPAYLSAVALLQGNGGVLAGGAFAGASLAALSHLVSTGGSLAGGVWSDRWGRQRVILALSLASIACSLLFGWLYAAPFAVLIGVALIYNFTAVGDSAIHSASLTEVIPPEHLPTAYSLRSLLGFGMGAISPWLFGVVLDRLADRPVLAWGAAWSLLGVVALLGPWMTWQLLRRQREEKKPAVAP